MPTGRLLEVRVSECKRLPCILRKGSEATIEMDFIPGDFAFLSVVKFIFVDQGERIVKFAKEFLTNDRGLCFFVFIIIFLKYICSH